MSAGAGDAGVAGTAMPSAPEAMTQLVAFSVAMFLGAFLAGYLPLSCAALANRMRQITVLGAGLLIGTALIVIIPEGMHMFFEASSEMAAHAHGGGSAAGLAGPSSTAGNHNHNHEHHHLRLLQHDGEQPGHEGHNHAAEHVPWGADSLAAAAEPPGHWQIGAALAVGFAFMLIIDRLSGGYGHAHAQQHLPTTSTSSSLVSSSSPSPSSSSSSGHSHDTERRNRGAMLGLMVHSAVDGVALGATIYSGGANASMVVFLAIMMHKAPAAFGLTTFLMQSGESQRNVRQQLIFFSLAAPTGAFLTFYGMALGLFSYEMHTLALIMLFSGGTFLFVATAHILPEILHAGGQLPWADTWIIVLGIVAPVFLNIGHGHAHGTEGGEHAHQH